MGSCLSSPSPGSHEKPDKTQSSDEASDADIKVSAASLGRHEEVDGSDAPSVAAEAGSTADGVSEAASSPPPRQKVPPTADAPVLLPGTAAAGTAASSTAAGSDDSSAVASGSSKASHAGAHPFSAARQSKLSSGSGVSGTASPMTIPGGARGRSSVDEVSGTSPTGSQHKSEHQPNSLPLLQRLSLTGRTTEYLRRHSSEGVHSTMDKIKRASQQLVEKGHGTDEEGQSSSRQAVASIDPSVYY